MKSISISQIFLTSIFIVLIALTGCSKKKDLKPDGSDAGYENVTDGDIQNGKADSDSNGAMGLKTIHFPYDSFEIVGDAKEDLKNNAEIMKKNQDLKVQIEGHCDERGGVQYNLALGEKRANAIKSALQSMGIAKSRIATISMGKEKPIANGSGEDVWAKNRRGNFVVTQK